MTVTASGKRTDDYATEAKSAYDRLTQAVQDLTGQFALSGFQLIDGQGHPTFSVTLTSRQAEILAEILEER